MATSTKGSSGVHLVQTLWLLKQFSSYAHFRNWLEHLSLLLAWNSKVGTCPCLNSQLVLVRGAQKTLRSVRWIGPNADFGSPSCMTSDDYMQASILRWYNVDAEQCTSLLLSPSSSSRAPNRCSFPAYPWGTAELLVRLLHISTLTNAFTQWHSAGSAGQCLGWIQPPHSSLTPGSISASDRIHQLPDSGPSGYPRVLTIGCLTSRTFALRVLLGLQLVLFRKRERMREK